jgi:hypothetical protein
MRTSSTAPLGRARDFLPPLLSLWIVACSDKPGAKPVANMATASPAPSAAMPPPIAETHSYRCDDDSTLIIDFLADGTTLLLRRNGAARPLTLTAPARGLDFIGERAAVTVTGRSIVLSEKNAVARTCVRA